MGILLLGAAPVAITSQLAFDLQWESSALAAPQIFRDSVTAAAALLSAAVPNTSMTLRVQVGYNDLSGPGGIGSLSTNLGASAETVSDPGYAPLVSYSAIRTALLAKSNPTTALTTFANNLPATSALNGTTNFHMSTGGCKALGLFGFSGGPTSSTDARIDAYLGIGSSVPTSVLVGVALHELSHAMGRYQASAPFDFSRYTAANTRDFFSGTSSYFSMDNGTTNLANYGSSSDVGDFLNGGVQDGAANDAFDEFYITTTPNSLQTLTAVDIQLLNCMGYT